eukprot:12217377-Alexandrium_andersonii.AAC.1
MRSTPLQGHRLFGLPTARARDEERNVDTKGLGIDDETVRLCFGGFVLLTTALILVCRPGEVRRSEAFEDPEDSEMKAGTSADRRKPRCSQVRRYRAEYAYEMRSSGIGLR